MSIIDISCKESFYLDRRGCHTEHDMGRLLTGGTEGNNYRSFLSFELPVFCVDTNILSARLVLYKIPISYREWGNRELNGRGRNYTVKPLLDFPSIYAASFAMARADEHDTVEFCENPRCAYEEINLTDLVCAWMDDKLENKGIVIEGCHDAGILAFASRRFPMIGMRPMMRIQYADTCNPKALSAISSSVEVH